MESFDLLGTAGAAAVGLIVAGILGVIAKQVTGVFETVKQVAESLNGVSQSINTLVVTNDIQSRNINTILTTQRYIITAGRHQNDSLTKLGANGSVAKANSCFEEAEKHLAEQLAHNNLNAMGTAR